MTTCYDLMTTDPVTCSVRSAAIEAAQLMKATISDGYPGAAHSGRR
jgi:hypothetical protein